MKKTFLFFLLFLSYLANGQNIITIAGNGTPGWAGDGNEATSAEMKRPNSCSFDDEGNMYIVDAGNCRIRKITTSGIISTIAGSGAVSFSGDGGPASAAGLYGPVSIAIDHSGNLYISTSGDHRIRKINTSSIISTIAGTGTFGYNGDNIPATAAQLYYPYIGVVDHFGNLYFGDYGNHRVRKIDTSGIITTFAGNGVPGSSGDGGPATAAEIETPGWVTISPSGEIYIPDNTANRIRKVDAVGVITTVAGSGGTGNTGDGGPATDATFMSLNDAAVDNAGNVYIADDAAYVIRKVNISGIISTVAGTGALGYSGDDGPATAATFNSPNTILFKANGNLVVADINNNRIREIIFHPEHVSDMVNASNDISIFPNPARDEVTIKARGNIEGIAITNMLGQKIIENQHNEKSVQIDVTGLSPGMYFVKVNGCYAGKFVKE